MKSCFVITIYWITVWLAVFEEGDRCICNVIPPSFSSCPLPATQHKSPSLAHTAVTSPDAHFTHHSTWVPSHPKSPSLTPVHTLQSPDTHFTHHSTWIPSQPKYFILMHTPHSPYTSPSSHIPTPHLNCHWPPHPCPSTETGTSHGGGGGGGGGGVQLTVSHLIQSHLPLDLIPFKLVVVPYSLNKCHVLCS